MDYFALFGLAPSYELDAARLRQRLHELQREYHPDRVAHLDDSARHQAVRQSALINDAYDTLSQPVKRAHYLLRLRGVELPSDAATFSDTTFLMTQMELREELAEASDNGDSDALLALHQQVQRASKALQAQIAAAFAAPACDGSLLIADVQRLTFYLKLEDEINRAEEALDL